MALLDEMGDLMIPSVISDGTSTTMLPLSSMQQNSTSSSVGNDNKSTVANDDVQLFDFKLPQERYHDFEHTVQNEQKKIRLRLAVGYSEYT